MKNLLLILVMLIVSVANAQDCNPLIQDGCDVTDPNVSEFNFGGCAAIAANDDALVQALKGGTATSTIDRKAELEGLSRNLVNVIITLDPFNDGTVGFKESYNYDGEIILDKHEDAQLRYNGSPLGLDEVGGLSAAHYKLWYDSTANRVRDLVAILL